MCELQSKDCTTAVWQIIRMRAEAFLFAPQYKEAIGLWS